jgi:hypothetical protein
MQDPPPYLQCERSFQTSRTERVTPTTENDAEKKDIYVDVRTVPTFDEGDNNGRAYSPDLSGFELTFLGPTKLPRWKPSSLRLPFLIGVILISLALILVLQILLRQSKLDGGILFAPNINALPLSTTFPYLYLPTILSVFYGFLWAWIDLDIRRLEPYFQLSSADGASGRESLLLHYPVDFLASVPVKALRFR